ncbi:hypothetical protein NDU88_007971 [Pleurodeles waltl]|uniref:Uncharacterized protein n=1 Tax=Pleurodeles waltl TaxID=8319 RepID=A0AAV7PRT0_PLEWA|nr:hypothetical protein NDU88_007971 [Pleurodeles waltl]
MHRFEPHSRVRAGLALFLHAQRYLHRKSCRTMIQKPPSVLRSHQPPPAMLHVVSPAAVIDLPVALQESVDL